MLLGSSWWALVRRWHRRDYPGRSGFFREVSWEWCPESASYEKQICVMCPLVNWNSFLFELTVQCWQCPPPVRWCRPWACTRRALAVCHLDSMLCRARIGILEYFEKKTCGRVHKDSSILQCPVNISHHWPNVPEEKDFRICFLSILDLEHQPTCCHRGCFPFFWIWHIPSLRPPSAPRSPVISMKFIVLPWFCACLKLVCLKFEFSKVFKISLAPHWWSRSCHGACRSSQGQSGQIHLKT